MLLLELLREYVATVEGTMERIRALQVCEQSQVDMLIERWEQIRRLVDTRIASLEGEITT